MQLPGVKEFLCFTNFLISTRKNIVFSPNYFTEEKIEALQREMIYEKGPPHPQSVILS